MRTEIIEILQKKYPEYCMQHIDTADEILRLFSVSNRRELLIAYHKNLIKLGDVQHFDEHIEDRIRNFESNL